MTYLYAGLGIAMLTGIMAIFEMSLSLTGRTLIPAQEDPYFQAVNFSAIDRDFLKLLNENSHLNAIGKNEKRSILCQKIESHIESLTKGKCPPQVEFCAIKDFKEDASVSPGSDVPFACALRSLSYRVIVNPGISQDYQLFSCILDGNDERCSFEGS
ncbi:hypothetical protein [Synechococcus sp. MIT S1220]|uniref:hypothetical protein n=1 Tax=Synechococcus sp. MIT S1220 TaxID=3082549 RepID=UPI0039B0B09C